jgi:hypothetical protein
MATEATYRTGGDSSQSAVLEPDSGWHTAETFEAVGPRGAGRDGDWPEVRAFAEARLALGARMCAAGIDDGRLCGEISGIEDCIRKAEAARLTSRALRRERDALLCELADAALSEDAPLPGAEAEYHKARQALAALQSARLHSSPSAGPRVSTRWKLLAASCAAVGAVVALAVFGLVS